MIQLIVNRNLVKLVLGYKINGNRESGMSSIGFEIQLAYNQGHVLITFIHTAPSLPLAATSRSGPLFSFSTETGGLLTEKTLSKATTF